MRGQFGVYGTAGGSLAGAPTFAVNAQVARQGAIGEQRTAELINDFARSGCAVFHDLCLPIPGDTTNIDHVVVSGTTVTVIDSKQWKPMRYIRVGQRAYRGRLRRFTPAESHQVAKAAAALDTYLGGRATMARAIYVVWPSSMHGRLNLRWLSWDGARVLTGEKFARRAQRVIRPRPADPSIVAALLPLVIDQSSLRPARTAA